MLFNARRLARLIIAERVDLVHARSRAPAWVALLACRIARTPLVTTCRDSLYRPLGAEAALQFGDGARRSRHRQFRIYRRSRRAPLSLGARSSCASSTAKPTLRKFSPSAVEAARVARLRKAWEVAPDERIVLLAARLTGWKGQKVLIEAARLLKARGVRGCPLHPRRRCAGPRRLCCASSTPRSTRRG